MTRSGMPKLEILRKFTESIGIVSPKLNASLVSAFNHLRRPARIVESDLESTFDLYAICSITTDSKRSFSIVMSEGYAEKEEKTTPIIVKLEIFESKKSTRITIHEQITEDQHALFDLKTSIELEIAATGLNEVMCYIQYDSKSIFRLKSTVLSVKNLHLILM